MNEILLVHKPVGLTPLQLLDQLRRDRPELKQEKLSYAGRLDPMAEGVMLILVGEANKERKKYLNLDKEYEFKTVLGISTDSYDLLGLVQEFNPEVKVYKEKLTQELEKFVGKNSLPYPPYSSKPVNNKPLWWWAREKRLNEIEMPLNTFEVYELDLLKFGTISSQELLRTTEEKIGKVIGDFRQKEILARWKSELVNLDTTFPLIQCRTSCSSGTYVRSIVRQLGQQLQTGAVTLSILRTKVGEYSL